MSRAKRGKRAASVADAPTVVYVHGIGNKPAPAGSAKLDLVRMLTAT